MERSRPHELVNDNIARARKTAAIRLCGEPVRYWSLPLGPAFRIAAVSDDGLVMLDQYPLFWFDPWLFEVVK